jgi:general bacterial porin, GBP family
LVGFILFFVKQTSYIGAEMRKWVASLGGIGIAMTAHAQSSVTLYGLIDTGLAYISNATSVVGAKGGSVVQAFTASYGNRVGLTGREDLGDGLAAIFTLENGFDGNTGKLQQGGRMFGRKAFVGLSSEDFGSFTIGRQYDMGFELVAPLTSWVQFASMYGAHIGDNDNFFQTFREQNSVKYRTTNYRGLEGGIMYAFSNEASAFSNNRAYNLGIRYARGPVIVAGSYLHLNNPSAGESGGTNTNGAVGGEYGLGASTIFYNAGPVGEQTVAASAIGYKFGEAKLGFVFSRTEFNYADASNLRLSNFELNASYLVSPGLTVGSAFVLTDGRASGRAGGSGYFQGDTPKWHQINFAVDYALSKRTGVHFDFVYQRAAGTAKEAAVNATGLVTGVNVHDVKFAALGLYHRF